jgi:predicted dehydrogenase
MATSPAPLRIGVIGLGQWGPNHVRNLRGIEGCDVVRVCDTAEARLAKAKKLFPGLEGVSDPRSITEGADIDAVVVSTPVQSHFALVRSALLAGKDVLCEKPLALDSADALALCALAKEKGRILMVGHVFLYNPSALHLKEAIDRGELGRIYYMDAVRTNLGPVRQDAGVVFDLASHDVSIFNFLLGTRPETVSAAGGSFLQSGIEDVAFLTLVYPRGVVCHVHTSWLNPRKVRQLTVVGDGKMAVWDDMNNIEPVRYFDKGVMPDAYSSFGEFHMILRDGAITTPKLKLYEPLAKQDQEFVDCLRSRSSPAASGQFGAEIVRVLEAARESLGQGGRVTSIHYP